MEHQWSMGQLYAAQLKCSLNFLRSGDRKNIFKIMVEKFSKLIKTINLSRKLNEPQTQENEPHKHKKRK